MVHIRVRYILLTFLFVLLSGGPVLADAPVQTGLGQCTGVDSQTLDDMDIMYREVTRLSAEVGTLHVDGGDDYVMDHLDPTSQRMLVLAQGSTGGSVLEMYIRCGRVPP